MPEITNSPPGLFAEGVKNCPEAVETALASLDWYADVLDANTGDYLSDSDPVGAGINRISREGWIPDMPHRHLYRRYLLSVQHLV